MSDTNSIPAMTDPLGRHWRQPADIRSAPMDEAHVLLTPAQVAGLSSYDSSIPSGVYPGKCWLRHQGDQTLLAWFGDEREDRRCPIMFREALVIAQ